MGTPGQADAPFTIEVEGVTYALDLDINGMCALEEAESAIEGKRTTFQDVCARIDAGDMRAIRRVVWASLQKHHKDADLELAGRVATTVVRGEQVLALMRRVIAGATPSQEDAEVLGLTKPNPPKAQTNRKGGTGPRSIARRGSSGSRRTRSAD